VAWTKKKRASVPSAEGSDRSQKATAGAGWIWTRVAVGKRYIGSLINANMGRGKVARMGLEDCGAGREEAESEKGGVR